MESFDGGVWDGAGGVRFFGFGVRVFAIGVRFFGFGVRFSAIGVRISAIGYERAYDYQFFDGRWNHYSFALRNSINFHCSSHTNSIINNVEAGTKEKM